MELSLSRRKLAQWLGGAAAAVSLPSVSVAASPAPGPTQGFPKGFLWGSATAAYQVEGAVHEAGRGVSIWDTFSHTPGKIANGDTGDVADDFFHRYKQDIALMKSIGLQTFRFSVAWTRIFPNGTGTPNPVGLDFYDRLTDALLEAGIVPYCTLFHWDLPQALEDKGGWRSRDTAKAYADYAGYVAGKLSSRVKHWMTMNEMRSFVEIGYRDGRHAPGLRLDRKAMAQLTHNVVYAQGLGVQAIRAAAGPGAKVGVADNAMATVPMVATPQHIAAARKAIREENAMFLTVILEGRYTEQYLKGLGADAPVFTAEELKVISTPLDFVGLNIYTASYVRADDSERGYAMVPSPTSFPHMLSSWLRVGPESMYWGPKLAAETWGIKEMYISENGASAADTLAPDGRIYDTDRTMFLRNYITQMQRAVADGVPIKGYFLWSLLDNYEWADGYDKRFGIIYVDFKTQQRIPKLSAEFYKEVIRTNSVA